MEHAPAIDLERVHKQFGDFVAVDTISLRVGHGEIFGIIGPNGAGKTTTVNMIAGMLAPDSGTVCTLGLDPIRQERELRRILGVQFQEAELPDLIRVDEALELYSAFYDDPQPWPKLANDWGLSEKLTSRFGTLSGGQKQRLFICLALLNRPQLVVLDELTTGLDPQARRACWDLIRQIRDQGTTVLLVTHFMDEAETLCDRIAVIDKGRIIAEGTPRELTKGTGDNLSVSFTTPDRVDLSGLAEFGHVETRDGKTVVTGQGFLMAHVAGYLARQGVAPDDLCMMSNSLEDVFLRMVDRTGEEVA
ncbi:MAG TPA: ABC transporter ATP-binding protein [Thermomicrobiales bacterium]|nr:ABC transporter ATP-binding protein [Thermomicrobiales bacterium]